MARSEIRTRSSEFDNLTTRPLNTCVYLFAHWRAKR